MEIYIQKPVFDGAGTAKIFVLEEQGRNRYSYQFDSKTNLIQQTLLEPNVATEVKPFIELPYPFFNDFVKAIVDYASKKNIKTESETLLQGKLVATEKHLEDLRSYFGKALEKIVSI